MNIFTSKPGRFAIALFRRTFLVVAMVFIVTATITAAGIYEKNNEHNVSFGVAVCSSDEGVIEGCPLTEGFNGVAGKQIVFSKTMDSLRFTVRVEPNWKGQVIVRRGNKSDPAYLGRSLPHAELKPGDETTLKIDFTPCRKDGTDCLRYDCHKAYRSGKNVTVCDRDLVSYTGVYEIRVLNGKVPIRSALALLVFRRQDEHVESSIRLFNRGQELHNGSHRKAKCKWFWCSDPKVSFVVPPTASSVWTERGGKLYKKYTKYNMRKRLVSMTTGSFDMKKKGNPYKTFYLDDMGRIGHVEVGRQ